MSIEHFTTSSNLKVNMMTECNRHNKHSSKSFLGSILAMIAILLIAGGLFGYYYYPHLYWRCVEWKFDLKSIEKIPNNLMPEVSIHEDWLEHSWGSMRFCLPPDMALFIEGQGTVIFRDENISIGVTQVTSPRPNMFLYAASQAHPTQREFLTLIQLRLESYHTAADDFRWSMNRREVVWHAFLMLTRSTLQPYENLTSTESFTRKNWEGLLDFSNLCPVSFDWECTCCLSSGYITFKPKEEYPQFDTNVVRAIIQSIEVNCGCSVENE